MATEFTPTEPTPPVEEPILTVENPPAEQQPVIEPTPQERAEAERGDLLKGVEDVLSKVAPATPTADTSAPEKPTADTAVADTEKKVDAKPDDQAPVYDEKEDEKLDFKDHPRFKALKDEAAALREKSKTFDTSLADLRQKAEAEVAPLNELRSFLSSNGLSGDEFAQGMEIMRSLKNDPARAAVLLAPHLKALDAFTGNGDLPSDLQARVASGEISDELAREMVRHKAAAAVAQQAAARTVQITHADQTQRVIAESQQAISEWEQNVSKSDPDYARRQPLMVKLLHAEGIANGAPRSRQDAINLVNKVYADATRLLPAAVVQPKPATKPSPSSASSSQSRRVVQQKPANLYEGVEGALAGIR